MLGNDKREEEEKLNPAENSIDNISEINDEKDDQKEGSEEHEAEEEDFEMKMLEKYHSTTDHDNNTVAE